MPIEFRCQQCGRLLRVPDDSAGKQAKCPECETIVAIPEPEPGATAPPPPSGDAAGGFTTPPPPPGGPSGSAFGSGAPENPYQSPHAPGAMGAPQPVAAGGFQATRIDMGDVFGRTWRIFSEQWGMCLLALIVLMLANGAITFVTTIVTVAFRHAAQDDLLAAGFEILVNLVAAVPSVWLSVGQAIFFLKVGRGEKAEIGDLFTGGPYLLTAFLATLLFGVVVIAGTLLCIVPGVIFALMFSQFLFLIVDRNVGVTDSLSLSSEITSGNKWMLFAIYLVAQFGALFFILITCFVGVFAAAPFLMLLTAVVYLAMTGQPTADQAPGSPYSYPTAPEPMA